MTDFFVHYRWNNISILKFENLKLETLNFETLNFETLNFEIWYFDISLFSSSENCHSTTAWQGGNTKQANHRLPCVNLFIGFDLSHAPPKAVLVILVDAFGEGVLQEPLCEASTFMSCTTTTSSLRPSYGRKVPLPLEAGATTNWGLSIPRGHASSSRSWRACCSTSKLGSHSTSLVAVNFIRSILQSSLTLKIMFVLTEDLTKCRKD